MRSFLASLLACFSLSAFAQTADTVLLHGRVYTGDPAKFAQAIAISGKRIIAVGTDEEIAHLTGAGTQRFDLEGRVVIPGLNDAHAEITPSPEFIKLSTGPDATWNDIKAALGWAGDESSSDKWIIGEVGPQALKDANATSAALNTITKGRKVVLLTSGGHAGLWSDTALAALRAGSMSDPIGGTFGHDASGRVNGQAFEYAQFTLAQKLADSADDAAIQQAIRDYSSRALGYGVTSVQLTSVLPYSRLHRALMRVDTPLRVREIETVIPPNPIDTGHPVLYILDGNPAEHGAAISGEYPGSKDSGTLNLTSTQLAAILSAAKKSGQQPVFHAAGDRAIRVLLDAVAAAGAEAPSRVRIEHADGLSGDLVPIAAKLGVVVVQNPRRINMKELYPATRAYVQLKPLVAARIPLALGSDNTPNPNPFVDLMVASVGNDGLTVAQAVDAFTSGAAYAELAEKTKGSIAPGQLADLAVLSQDIFKSAWNKIPETRAVVTMIDGKVVFGTLSKAH
jgi:predicted amidohydrolase YtcJ